MPAVLGLSSHSNTSSIVPFPINLSPSSLNLAFPLVILNSALASSPCPSRSLIVLLLSLILPLKYVLGLLLYFCTSLSLPNDQMISTSVDSDLIVLVFSSLVIFLPNTSSSCAHLPSLLIFNGLNNGSPSN